LLAGTPAIAIGRPPAAASKPFVTRQSTLLFSGLFLASAVAYQLILGADTSGSGGVGVAAAAVGATAFVTGLVAWLEAVVIALRSGSLLWLLVAVLPIVPINSLVCAMFCPQSVQGTRR